MTDKRLRRYTSKLLVLALKQHSHWRGRANAGGETVSNNSSIARCLNTDITASAWRRRRRPMHVVDDGVLLYAVNDGILRRRTYAVDVRMHSKESVTTLLKYCGLSERCLTVHNDIVWKLRRGTPDSARHVWTFAMWQLTFYSLGGRCYQISVSAWEMLLVRTRTGLALSAALSPSTDPSRPPVESLSMNPLKQVTPSTTERQSSSCSNLSRSHQCQADRRLNHCLFTVTSSSFVRYCGQGSSLLWTPALRPLCRSNTPAQGEEGNW